MVIENKFVTHSQARTQKVRAFRGMEDTKYNGWTNYATWRINLEILSDMEFDEQVSADYLKDLVEELVFIGVKDCLAADYARAFISDVNFYEIAKAINEDV
jgi:hypothetical protein